MSDIGNNTPNTKSVVNYCRKSVVKSLILEFEQFSANEKIQNIGMLRMGADQSTLTKSQGNPRPATISASGLVKQRVTQFDYKLESENQSDKKKRHKSIVENDKNKISSSKDYQRSKSYDYVRREKDRYSRTRQATPKEEPFKFEIPNQKISDSNNNNTRRKIPRRKPVQETRKNEDKKDIKTILKSQQPEAPVIATEIQNKEDYTKTVRKDIQVNSKSTNKTPIRSVKSIKRIFEGPIQKASRKPILTKTNSDRSTIDDNKLSSITDNEVICDNKITQKLKSYAQDDEYKNTSDKDIETLESISEKFSEANSEISDNYSEDEFNQIQNRFQEVEQTLKEIEQNRSNPNLYDEEPTRNEIEEPENINVYVENCTTDDELEDEFGKRSFINFDTINFTEAYNRDGDELIITSVAAIEHRSLYESFTSNEFLSLDFSDQIEQASLTTSANELEKINEPTIEKSTILDNQLDSAVENKLYFSTEEIQETENEIPSNRSTFYSNTATNSSESMERYSKAESDEGVEIEKENEPIYEEIRLENVEIRTTPGGGFDRTIKTETIYDSFKNPRIAKVTNVNSKECASNAQSPIQEEPDQLDGCRSPTGLKPKKDYLIEELIKTEKKYIEDLKKVVWDYMTAITDEKLPPSLIGKSRYLFGNIKKIYTTTQSFYKALKLCGTDHEEIAKTFIRFKYLFELYPLYSKNKPKADQFLLGDFKDIVSAREQQLNDRLGLASNLLTPIQRLGKYILFLEQIQKELLKKSLPFDNIYQAIQVVRKEMSRGNDYLAIDSIKDCPVSLIEQGSFVMRNKFNVIKPRKYEAVLFLFEEILVFTVVDPKDQERFIYKDSIKLNEMGIVIFENLGFRLRRFPSYKTGTKQVNEFEIEAKKEKDKKTWTEQIEKRLWEQLVKCKEQQKEMNSNQGKRTSVTDLPNRIRRKKDGYASLPGDMRKKTTTSIFYYKVDRDA